VAKRLRPLALQATAAERAEKLAVEIAGLRAGIATIDLAQLGERSADAEKRGRAVVAERKQLEERLEAFLRERERVEEELAAVAGGREGAAASLYRLRSGRERLELRRESAQDLVTRLREPVVEHVGAQLEEQARIAEARAAALRRALDEREGLPPAARALSERGERLALSALDVAAGDERAVAAALGHLAPAVLADSAERGLALVQHARTAGLGSLVVLVGRDPAELVADVKIVPAEELLASSVPVVTREGIGYDPQRGELWFAGETAEAVWLELEARRRALATEVEELDARAEAPIPEEAYSATHDPLTESLARLAARLVDTLAGVTDDRHEAPLRARADAGAQRTTALAEELRKLGAAEVDARRATADAGERLTAIDVERARIEAELDEARRRLEAAAAEAAEGDDRDELAERIERLERRRESLGQVNPLAKQEYEQEKERLTELSAQREDLEVSLAELQKLRDDLTRTVEERFAETFASVQANFAEVAATLFPGGEGRLRLTEPEEEGEQPGIEVELRPVGKKVTRLSLLSGGEKALGAISFLFALFLARPCPFYLLDEVEAALDDTNIGRFVELLRRYADRTQFIVITHQKRTMEAADILYGVTMGADGVSQIVSRRLPQEQAVAVAS
jgi:chromosome segregation ATPase